MPSKVDLVNQVLSEFARPPVANISDDDQALLISARLDVYLQELLQRCNWNFAIKYKSDNTPVTQNFSPDFVYTYQLPFDFGKIFKFSQMWLAYEFVDGFILANQKPIMYYYIVNMADYSVLPILFQRVLTLYTAARVCLVLTNNEQLTLYLEKEYEQALSNAIKSNDMERLVSSTPYNDFDRFSYV